MKMFSYVFFKIYEKTMASWKSPHFFKIAKKIALALFMVDCTAIYGS